jgi:serine/threonine protein kinase
MSEDPIHSLCERFYVRLRDCRSTNVQNYAFFPNGTAKNVFHTNQAELRELLGYTCQRFGIPTSTPVTSEADLARRVLADFNNILAAIIWARLPSAEEFLRDFLHLFPEIIGSIARPLITDDDLPISLPLARRVFPTNAQDFYDEQFRFCAVTLMKREEVIYKGERCLCPLPYLEESEIAEGSFGRVFRVRIEGQHVVSRGSQSINQKPRYCARKDFPVNRERAFQWEQEILKRIHRQPRSNENVMVAIASLQYGDTYSLFFELATCNLWDYLYGKYDSTRPVPSGVETRSDIYRRGVALAGALAFLHHEFRDQKLDNLSCYHLDLKPHNVLVFNAYTPAEIWKITDFGVSRVKGRSDDGEEVQMLTPFLRKTRRVKAPREELTRNPRGEGTYLAPECAQRNGKVGSASDVWSWGCIFSLVMTYLEGGHAAVQEFRMERQKQKHRDAFYVMKSNNTAQISPTIISWFNHLRYQARVNRNGREFELVRQTLDFLERRVLLPNHTQRATAKEVETCLSRFSHLYYEQPSEEPRAKGVRASIARWKNRIPLSSSAISSVRFQDIPVDMASGIRASLFSPDGKLLALYSPQSIKAIPTNQIMQSITRQTAVPDLVTISEPKGSWECVAVSSRYICGGLAGDCFDVSSYRTIILLKCVERRPDIPCA